MYKICMTGVQHFSLAECLSSKQKTDQLQSYWQTDVMGATGNIAKAAGSFVEYY